MLRQQLIFAALIFSAAGATPAATVCVTSGNQLASALATAETNGQDDDIRVVSGSMQRLGNFPEAAAWTYDPVDTAENLTLSGGWSAANNCQTQTQNAAYTELDARHVTGSLEIFPRGSSSGSITVSNFTFSRGSPVTSGNPSHIFLRLEAGSLASIAFDRNIVITGNTTMVGSAAVTVQGLGGAIRLRGNVFAFNDQQGPTLRLSAQSGGLVYFNNNTVYENASHAPGNVAAGADVIGGVYLANNVFHDNVSAGNGNAEFDVFNVTSGTAIYRNNHIGHMQGAASSESDTTTGDPQWTITGTYPRAKAVSPLRDSGRNSPLGGLPAIDAAGNQRVLGGTVDRGAMEADVEALPPAPDAMFANGFE